MVSMTSCNFAAAPRQVRAGHLVTKSATEPLLSTKRLRHLLAFILIHTAKFVVTVPTETTI
jgi:hypothetical protein